MVKQLPTISIIIPVYNVENYISTCIESVINQTYDGTIECLIIDDCTPDKSIEKVENLIRNLSKDNITFKIIKHKINRGLSAARNTGIKEASGEYLYFIDGDDYITTNCIEDLIALYLKHPNVQLIQGGAISKRFKEFSLQNRKDLPEYTTNKEWIKCSFLQKNVFPVTSWNKLVKKDFIIKNDLFFKENIIHEDEHWNFFVCKKLESMAFCLKDTYYYIERNCSIMNAESNNKSISSRLIILNDFIDNIDLFCRNEQIAHIFTFLHYMFIFYPTETSIKCKKLLRKLSLRCNLTGKIVIWFILHSPKILNKRRIIYDCLIHHTLLPYF